MQPRLKTQYNEVVLPQLRKDFDYGNVMEVPKLEKIVLNTCLKEAITNMKILDSAAAEIGLISGQKPIITKARKSIANFKLREGMPLGAKVTLRQVGVLGPLGRDCDSADS
jgi:large subunit ribosomal protein L5